MVGTTSNDSNPSVAEASPSIGDPLRKMQREMFRQVVSASTKVDLLHSLAASMSGCAQLLAVVYFQGQEQGQFSRPSRLQQAGAYHGEKRLKARLTSACQAACEAGELQVSRLVTHTGDSTPTCMIVAAPISLRGGAAEVIGVAFTESESTRFVTALVQMVVSHIVLWDVMAAGRDSDSDARDSSALVELLNHVTPAPNVRRACYTLAAELAAYLQCKRVAVGLRSRGNGPCRLVAISGVARFDKRSKMVHAVESAMDEAVLRDAVTRWPASDDAQRHAALAQKNLCLLEGMQAAVSSPLRVDEGHAVGAIIVLADTDESLSAAARFLRIAEPSLANALTVAQRLEGGWLARLARAASGLWQRWQGKVVLTAIALALAAMLIPLPYNIRCDCQIEPVTRRFVVAPFEGTLEKSLVKPGDVVQAGDVLARMEGREIRWERASVVADHDRATKKRDVAQASHSYADQQIAQLEMERLELMLQLLDHRAENLEIKSPISGIVTSGDLERAEGAPLAIGQSLFEIAPIEKMIVEIALPDHEVSHVEVGQNINVRLDAYPGQTWQAVVAKVQPRSEIRGEDNVFIVEAALENTASRLRPGMKGRAQVETQPRRLGWILFHKPWEYLTKKMLW